MKRRTVNLGRSEFQILQYISTSQPTVRLQPPTTSPVRTVSRADVGV